jgi:crossover junction endodeoxyribonuclease RuvC
MIIGIDPGLNGAAAAVTNSGSLVDVIDIPTLKNGKRREVNTAALITWLRDANATHIVMESVHSMPWDGHVGAFRFGVSVGKIVAACELVTPDSYVETVGPTMWKSYFDLSDDKEEARQLALKLFPYKADHLTRKMDHNRAEAMLIAWYAIRPPIGRNW